MSGAEPYGELPYGELQVTSNFSFLRGASFPHELVVQAKALGHQAVAITDRNTLAGIVRAWVAARDLEIKLIIGCRLDLQEGHSLLCYPRDKPAYNKLCRLLTRGRMRAPKGECWIGYADLLEFGEGQILVALPPDKIDESYIAHLKEVARDFAGSAYLAAQHLYRDDDARRLHRLALIAREVGLPLAATNDVHYHLPERRPLQDIVTCIREGCTLADAGFRLNPHAERHLKSRDEMARLFRDHPAALAGVAEIIRQCNFSLKELEYNYPDETGADGTPPQILLERLTWQGAAWRYPKGLPEKTRKQLTQELALIAELKFAPYFLTVHAIVMKSKSLGILCQGRGSAANSSVCFCLGVTEVNPENVDLLFARFLSGERKEPPDIDVDFEHERREEIIQHIYQKYGRDRAALTATVVHYRPRRAIREVGKVLGLSEDVTAALAGTVWGWYGSQVFEKHVVSLGLDPHDPALALALRYTGELVGFPRHLSQHVGGFVITRDRLEEMVPIENASMAERTVIEWDKDDIAALGMMKIDVLALGMLSAIRRGFDLIQRHYGGERFTNDTVPKEDPRVYEMLKKADSIGVFQVESRAQMSMLPRLKPKEFYDLVIEVAIVRPGPIQGGMVHPYLRRREGTEKVDFPSEALRDVLKRTLGVPLFQEQAMRIAIVGAGFSDIQADGLRRAMATFRRNGQMELYEEQFISGMIRNGYKRDCAVRCFDQIKGFGDYGFPESHAASFALLVYVSAWIKCFYPAVFTCALLNSQPMGFYRPAQLVRDAIEHGVEVREVDVNFSDWHCTLEPATSKPGGDQWALRLGLCQVKGLAQDAAEQLVGRRGNGYTDIVQLARRGELRRRSLECLAEADAFRSLGFDRRQALWTVKGIEDEVAPLFLAAANDPEDEPLVDLPVMPLGQHVIEDYARLGLSLKSHPVALLRGELDRRGILPAARLKEIRDGEKLTVAGIVLVRQRPGEGNVIFVTLEDETSIANVIVWPRIFERFRRSVMGGTLIACTGKLQNPNLNDPDRGQVVHLVADRIEDLSHLLRGIGEDQGPRAPELVVESYDFH